MKTHLKNLFLLPALIAALNLIPAGRVTAQTFTTLHSFTGSSDGANPRAGLILSGNTLYGTAQSGGSSGYGTAFAANTDGTGFTTLHSFSGGSGGAYPFGLILSGSTLYGTASGIGIDTASSGWGTVFRINTDGTGFTNLYNFSGGSDGAYPIGGLILSGNSLYGATSEGGSYRYGSYGTVFGINTDGMGFTNLYSFTDRSDGAYPSGVILSGDALYGTTTWDGVSGAGTLCAVSTDGAGLRTLYSFTPPTSRCTNSGPPFGIPDCVSTNSDGAIPRALVLSGNTLYGTAQSGGSSGYGTVFAVNTDGTGLRTLHSFSATSDFPYFDGTNSDGAFPYAGLIVSSNILCGAASSGGSSGNGTVFMLNTDGTGFTTLHSFTALHNNTNSDGASPRGPLILSANILYGTTLNGGSSGHGTVFSISLPVSAPQLTVIPCGANVILTWPTNAAGFTLQSTTNLVSPVWTTNSSSPVIVNGQYAVTNLVSGTRKFFRLIQ